MQRYYFLIQQARKRYLISNNNINYNNTKPNIKQATNGFRTN